MTETEGIVILIDDDADVRGSTAQLLRLSGFDVMPFAAAATALKYVSPSFEGVIVSDVRMPKMNGNELLKLVREIDPEIPVIFVTGHGDVRQALAAVHEGARDYLTKPFEPSDLSQSVRRALAARIAALDDRSLRHAIDNSDGDGILAGTSKRIMRLRQELAQAAQSDADILILGETGAGKSSIALAIHSARTTRRRPVVTLTCGALTDASLELELFGAEPGYGSGAIRRRTGRVEQAHGGDLIIDDVDYASPALQNFLHFLLTTRKFRRAGASSDTAVDFRAISTAHPGLAVLAQQGVFRKDLYYCLDVVTIIAPSLRERAEDVPEIFNAFVKQAETRFRRRISNISDAVRRRLVEHDWPGNLRELNAFAERVVLGFDAASDEPERQLPLPQRVEQFERGILVDALAAAGGNVQTAIRALGLPRKTFYDKLVKYSINVNDFRSNAGATLKDPGA